AQELSDGTLRFLLLACALLAPRPAPLLVLNEPEASLHGALIPALASLIDRARDDSQVIVVSHNRALVTSLLGIDADLVELHKDLGETMVTASDLPPWTWPKR
ncbi:MAG: AAA family ATPase, partial [Pseudomonadota bacterium]